MLFSSVTILINNTKNGVYKELADYNVDSLEDMISLLQDNSMAVQRNTQSSVQEGKGTNTASK
jgi:PHD/YefM family antitoxin component YafN of YafNO toxin-antitoxin module